METAAAEHSAEEPPDANQTAVPSCLQITPVDDACGEGEGSCSCFEPVPCCTATGQPAWVSAPN